MIYMRKTPNEKIPHTVHFTDLLPEDEALDSFNTLSAVDEDGNDATSDLIDGSGSLSSPDASFVSKAIGAGVYTVTMILLTTPGSYLLEEIVILTVVEGG